jgi:hypothetical protein
VNGDYLLEYIIDLPAPILQVSYITVSLCRRPPSMAADIYTPSVIFPEITPGFLFQNLPIQSELLTPASANSGIPTSPRAAVSSFKLARSMIRIFHAHYGTVPDKTFEDIATGCVTYNNGQKVVSAGGREFRSDKLSGIITDVQSE